MKQQIVNVLTKVGFLSVMAFITVIGSAQGQSLEYKLRANIPFDFIVADKKMPAGEYSVGRAQRDSGDTLVQVSSLDGRSNAIRLTTPIQILDAKDKGALVFHRYRDQYFLFQVWPAGANTGRVLPKSRSEREIEGKLAANSSVEKMATNGEKVETVVIAGGLQ